MFGDRMHLRIKEGKTQEVIVRLQRRIQAEGVQDYILQPVPAQLEDIFSALIEQQAVTR